MQKVLGLVLITFMISCQELEPVFPPPELDLVDRYGEFVDTVFTATQDTFIVDYRINTGFSQKLSIGSYDGFQASFLIRFLNIPDEDKLLDSVYIQFTGLQKFGDDIGDLTVNVYEVEQEWDESANEDDFWHNQPSMPLIKSITLSSQDSSIYNVSIEDTSLIRKWQREQENNKGLFFQVDAASSGYIRELVSSEGFSTLGWPRMYYKIFQDTVFVNDSTNISLDATIFDYFKQGSDNIFESARNSKELLISSGIRARTFVRFDQINSLPENSILQGANLMLLANDESFTAPGQPNNLVNSNHLPYFYTRVVSEANENLSYYRVDSTFISNSFYSNLLIKEDNDISFTDNDQTNFGKYTIQDIVNGSIKYEWFLIHYQFDYSDISVERLLGRIKEPPLLNIRYLVVDNNGIGSGD